VKDEEEVKQVGKNSNSKGKNLFLKVFQKFAGVDRSQQNSRIKLKVSVLIGKNHPGLG
jgi:hypothetical protein